jgi:hypothetical protein
MLSSIEPYCVAHPSAAKQRKTIASIRMTESSGRSHEQIARREVHAWCCCHSFIEGGFAKVRVKRELRDCGFGLREVIRIKSGPYVRCVRGAE